MLKCRSLLRIKVLNASGSQLKAGGSQLTKKSLAISPARYYLCASSLKLLIKKGRGIWPCEALATNNVN